VGAELFRVDEPTDMTKLIVAFRNFANASEIVTLKVFSFQFAITNSPV
jgi:hypothetical protein